MKKASIVTGEHFAGKSKTIREFLKPLLGMTTNEHKFIRNKKSGYILSQSFEESDKDVDDIINRYAPYYDLLVLAARPASEAGSKFNELSSKLKKRGFDILEHNVIADQPDSFYKQKANDILNHLDS